MQVTDAMVAAAQDATPRWMNATDNEIRRIAEAALAAAADFELPVTATIRVQIDEQAFHASAAEAVQHLHNTLPRDQHGRITIASLSGAPEDNPYRPSPLTVPASLLDAAALARNHWIPVTEQRPLAHADQLHYHLGETRDFIQRAIAAVDGQYPTFPKPVCEYGKYRTPLYDPDAVKAWYDGLPQAANE